MFIDSIRCRGELLRESIGSCGPAVAFSVLMALPLSATGLWCDYATPHGIVYVSVGALDSATGRIPVGVSAPAADRFALIRGPSHQPVRVSVGGTPYSASPAQGQSWGEVDDCEDIVVQPR